MERRGNSMGKNLLRGSAAMLILAPLLAAGLPQGAQTFDFDLARDWSLMGKPYKGMPFGPEYAWSVCAIRSKPERGESFDRAMHFTISNPWLDIYGIDGWWLGSSPVARKPMVGKNVGQGNIPGMVHGVNYDWPVGKVAAFGWPGSDQSKGELPITAVVWTAPRATQVSIAGGIWMAGQYLDFAVHRTRVMMWINQASANGAAANQVVFQDAMVPLWTEGYDSGHPESFAQILGDKASRLEMLKLEKGDRIAVGFYLDTKAAQPGLSGVDFRVAEVLGAR